MVERIIRLSIPARRLYPEPNEGVGAVGGAGGEGDRATFSDLAAQTATVIDMGADRPVADVYKDYLTRLALKPPPPTLLKIKLCITHDSVHYDESNNPLVGQVFADDAVRWKIGGRFLDVGCGSGLWGLTALGCGFSFVAMTDVCEESVSSSLASAKLNQWQIPQQCVVKTGSLLKPAREYAPFDVIFFNPPQTGGPPAFYGHHKCGGADGSRFYLEMLSEIVSDSSCGLPNSLSANGCIIYLQISLSNIAKVKSAFEQAGFTVREVARQQRELSIKDMEALCPGLWQHQIRLRDEGASTFEMHQSDKVTYTQHAFCAQSP